MNVRLNGVSYFVDTWGGGHPLLLLHGFTGSSKTWKSYQPYWEKHSAVIAPDLIGHGQTEVSQSLEDYTMEASVQALAVLLEERQVEKVDILGYSMGGRLALSFAMTYPEKVRKLVLESSSPGLKTEEDRNTRRNNDEKLAQSIMNGGIEQFVDRWEDIPLFASQKRLPDDVRAKVRLERLGNNEIGLASSLRGMGTGAQPSWWGALEKLHIPTLLVTGSLDEKFCQIAKEMIEKIPSSQWINEKDCGHAIHVEKPEKFGTIVSDFLNK